MRNWFWLILVLGMFGSTLAGCAPVLVGAAGAVLVDGAMERKRGGDGLF